MDSNVFETKIMPENFELCESRNVLHGLVSVKHTHIHDY